MSAGLNDSVLTTASSATQPGTKKSRAKKGTAAKAGRKKTKKEEPSELQDQSSQMDEESQLSSQPAKARRGKKRSSDAIEESTVSVTDGPMSKKRAAQGPGNDTIDSIGVHEDDSEMTDVSTMSFKKNGAPKRGRKPKLNSHASMASLRAPGGFPDDDEIERQLEADLERQFTDDEEIAYDSDSGRHKARANKTVTDSEGEATQSTKPRSPEYNMFGPVVPPDEDEIDDDLRALQAEMEVTESDRPLQVPKKGRKAGVQKTSKQTKAKAKPVPQEQETETEFPESQPEDMVEPVDVSVSSTGSVVKKPILAPPVEKRGRGRPRASLASQDESVAAETDESAQPARRGRGRPSRVSLASLLSAGSGDGQTAEPPVKRGRGRPSNASLASLDSTGVDEDIKTAPAPATKRRGRPSKTTATSYNPGGYEAPKRGRGRPAKKMVETRPVEQTETEAEDDFVEAREVLEEPPRPQRTSPIRAIFSPKGKAPSLGPTPMTPSKLLSPVPSARQPVLSPSQSPQSSDAENQPPSRAPGGSAAKRVVLAPVSTTPTHGSPSKRNVIAGLRSTTPWASASLEAIFDSPLGSPGKENEVDRFLKRGKELTSPERQMSVEEWIYFNAAEAEKKLKYECESLVNRFEMEGTRAIKVLEGLEVEAAS